MTEPVRNSRLDEPVVVIPDGELEKCQHCGRVTWPVSGNDDGRHIEQCLYCLQRYDVAASE